MNAQIEILDLGDACVETRQASPYPMMVDNMAQYGWF